MNNEDARGIPPGWDLDSEDLVSLRTEVESEKQITFARVIIDKGGSTTFSYRSQLQQDLAGKSLYLSFRARPQHQEVKALAVLRELPAGAVHAPVEIEVTGETLAGYTASRRAVGGPGIREIQLSFEITGPPGSTLDIEDVILHYFE